MQDAAILIPILLTATVFGTMTYVIVATIRIIARSRRDKQVTEMQNKLIDKFASGTEVMGFVGSEAYKNLVSAGESPAGSAGKVLATLQSGVITFSTGAGVLLVSVLVPGIYPDFAVVMRVIGGIVLAVGIGTVAAAGWSYLLLKRWGLMKEEGK